MYLWCCRGKPLSEAVNNHGADVVLMSDVVYYEEVGGLYDLGWHGKAHSSWTGFWLGMSLCWQLSQAHAHL